MGSKKEVINFSYLSEQGKIYSKSHTFEGILNNLNETLPRNRIWHC
jgi:excinuclease ABC subunit A